MLEDEVDDSGCLSFELIWEEEKPNKDEMGVEVNFDSSHPSRQLYHQFPDNHENPLLSSHHCSHFT